MPIYEYKCKKCGTVSEHIQKFSDSPLTDCGECGAAGTLEKLMSLSSFHLKGSGWYVTDYGRNSNGNSSTTRAKASRTETKSSTESTKSTTSKAED